MYGSIYPIGMTHHMAARETDLSGKTDDDGGKGDAPS